MRLRFSLRLVFIVLTLAAIAVYLLIARPTLLANRFVAAIDKKEYQTAKEMLPESWRVHLRDERLAPIDRIYAEALPREWGDICRCRRRIILRTARHNDKGAGRIDWTEDTDIVARPHGLQTQIPTCVPALRRIAAFAANHQSERKLLP